ncbi:ATP-binding family member B [Purpureocillium lavendulum]|uniref:GPN-loop GTPase 2 n=1 Tax=Purpureocillium lavendulum TaxID=1247861 RepID=A0AB34FZH5_9HYPO|nr:ATP-binding family member B [Purpureocillium lavendulum]
MPFAQLVLGSPGSGKSTYCDGMHQFMGAIGRACSVVNLDPANDHTNYPCALDIRNLIKLEDIMRQDRLGPNGGILYALEELEHNFEWLEAGLKELGEDYILFDCPGQVELYTHHNSLRNIFYKLQRSGFRASLASCYIGRYVEANPCQFVCVHLSDSICVTQPSLYVSNVLLSLRAMIQMDMPHVNVLSKIDKVSSYDELPFNLEYYTDVDDLTYLTPYLEAESPVLRSEKFGKLNEAIAKMIESYGLVRYEVLAVENKKSMMYLLRVIDRAGGYVFGGAEGANDTIWAVAMRNETSMMDVQDIQERWIDQKEDYDRLEREADEEQARIAQEQATELGQSQPPGPAQASQDTGMEMETDPDFGDMSVPADGGVKVTRKK